MGGRLVAFLFLTDQVTDRIHRIEEKQITYRTLLNREKINEAKTKQIGR